MANDTLQDAVASASELTKKLIKEIADNSKSTLEGINSYSLHYVPDWLTMQFLVNNTIFLAPLFSYGSTVYSIRKRQSSMGFSIDICCTMMVSSILRINFYFIEPFEYTLLKQAIVMIFIHIILLKVALKYKLNSSYSVNNLHDFDSIYTELKNLYTTELNKEFFLPVRNGRIAYGESITNEKSQEYVINKDVFSLCRLFGVLVLGTLEILFKNFVKFFDPYYKRSFEFWQWNQPEKYWKFIGYFAITNTICTLLFRDFQVYGNIIGSASLFIESLLPLPQILLLNRIKTINGFKTVLLFSWYCGDLTKIGYLLFGARNISFIFIFFAVFQMLLDIIIGFQYVYYKYYFQMDYKQADVELQSPRLRRSIELADLNVEEKDTVRI